MKFNKYFLVTSALVLNTLVTPIAVAAKETQVDSDVESIEQAPLLKEDPMLNQEITSSSEQVLIEESTQMSEKNNTNDSTSEQVPIEESTQMSGENNTNDSTSEQVPIEESTQTSEKNNTNDSTSENHATKENTEKDVSETIDVDNWPDFINAFANPNIKKINIIDNIEVPKDSKKDVEAGIGNFVGTNNSGGLHYIDVHKSKISRDLTIEGNGHEFDFKAMSISLFPVTHNPDSPWNIELKNLKIYHGNWYGPLTTVNLGNYGYQSNIIYNNVEDIGSQLTCSPTTNVIFRGNVRNIQVKEYTSSFGNWKIYPNFNQANLEVTNVTLEENADVTLSTINAGNIALAYYAKGNLLLKKNSTLNLIGNGTQRGEADGGNITNYQGNVYVEEGAVMNLEPKPTDCGISLRSSSASVVVSKGAEINIKPKERTASDNGYATNYIYLASNSKFIVKEFGKVSIVEDIPNTSPSHMIFGENGCNLLVEKDGTLDIQSNSTNSIRSLIYLNGSNSKFNFANAQKINLQNLQEISNDNSLIQMSGNGGLLDVDVQKVNLWNKNNTTNIANDIWEVIFNLQISYNQSNPSIKNVNTIKLEDETRFKEKFTTKNVQRVLFEKIPDVEVTIDEPLYNDSRVISGKATPNSYIYFEGINVEGEISSPIVGDSKKYHVMTDKEGNYRFELPKNVTLEVGKTITAEAFLNGQTAQTSTIVQKNPNPEPTNPNIPSQDVDNTKPEQISLFGIAYMPKQFQISKTELKDSGKQTISFNKTDRFDIGVRDQRNKIGKWVLKAQLIWNKNELTGARINTTNDTGVVMKNTNNGTTTFNPDTDLTSSDNEVTGMKNVIITSEQSAPIMEANNVAHNAVYNYNLGNVYLEIPEVKSIQPGVYEGFVEWNLSNTL